MPKISVQWRSYPVSVYVCTEPSPESVLGFSQIADRRSSTVLYLDYRKAEALRNIVDQVQHRTLKKKNGQGESQAEICGNIKKLRSHYIQDIQAGRYVRTSLPASYWVSCTL